MTSAKLRAGLLSALPALDGNALKDLEALAMDGAPVESALPVEAWTGAERQRYQR